MVRVRSKNFSLLRQSRSGQAVIEYILLFAVSMSFIYLIFQSSDFKDAFGEEGLFAKTFAQKIACNYRYGDSIAQGRNCAENYPAYNSIVHPLYFPTSSDTRFFGPRSPYPNP